MLIWCADKMKAILNISIILMNSFNINDIKKRNTRIINDNIYQARYGIYASCPKSGSIKFQYLAPRECDPGPTTNICNVFVINKHPIDVVNEITTKGVQNFNNQKIPVMMYPVGRDFLGVNFESREGIYDETLLLKTNYASNISRCNKHFPIKEDNEVIYTQCVIALRDNYFNFMSANNIYQMGVITISPFLDPKIIESEKCLVPSDLLKIQILMETIFQVSIYGNHNVLILTPFDSHYKIPIDDQIKVINLCILKYGHKFKDIVIAIPKFMDKSVNNYFDEKIIKPQIITQTVDSKYESELAKKKLMSICPPTKNQSKVNISSI
jgi:hypothetical protein